MAPCSNYYHPVGTDNYPHLYMQLEFADLHDFLFLSQRQAKAMIMVGTYIAD